MSSTDLNASMAATQLLLNIFKQLNACRLALFDANAAYGTVAEKCKESKTRTDHEASELECLAYLDKVDFHLAEYKAVVDLLDVDTLTKVALVSNAREVFDFPDEDSLRGWVRREVSTEKEEYDELVAMCEPISERASVRWWTTVDLLELELKASTNAEDCELLAEGVKGMEEDEHLAWADAEINGMLRGGGWREYFRSRKVAQQV
jgi:hypothetical protein